MKKTFHISCVCHGMELNISERRFNQAKQTNVLGGNLTSLVLSSSAWSTTASGGGGVGSGQRRPTSHHRARDGHMGLSSPPTPTLQLLPSSAPAFATRPGYPPSALAFSRRRRRRRKAALDAAAAVLALVHVHRKYTPSSMRSKFVGTLGLSI